MPASPFRKENRKNQKRRNEIMNRLFQRLALPFICGLALIVIPISTSAQSTPAATQNGTNQNQPDQNQINQQNQTKQNVDQGQSQDLNGHTNPDQSDVNRQKPSGTTDPNTGATNPN